jgi:hypothetical protein
VATQRKAIILLSMAAADDRLSKELEELVSKCPTEALEHVILLEGTSATSLVDLVTKIRGAAQVIIQEPPGILFNEHITAAAAARACNIPLLLISPTAAGSPLARIADVLPSDIEAYPTRRDDISGWEVFHERIISKRRQVEEAYLRADKGRYLDSITAHLSSAALTLDQASPDEDTALTIARVFEAQNRAIRLENNVDHLQLDFPATLYTDVLAQLTGAFSSVRTIADPTVEELPWNDPVESRSLSRVTERTFALDEENARQFGLEPQLAQVYAALRAGGQVTVVGLSHKLKDEVLRASPANRRLKGLNRFYAGNNIVGGYADDSGEHIRLLAYHNADRQNGPYAHEMEILARLDQRKLPVPGDVETDSTTLASWIYSNVFTKPNLDAIYEHTRSAYADEYDGNIVRVTPGYFTQLDKLTAEAKRALVALYAPYSGRERRNMRVLELGFGTGALTGRIMRMCSEFLDQMQTGTELGDLPSIEIEGWDANSTMVKIATTRLMKSIRRPISRTRYPDLRLMKYAPDSHVQTGDRYDLVVGSFVIHYWMDSYPNGPVTSSSALLRFTGFLSSLRDQLLAPGGLALFVDTFYDQENADDERRLWANYAARQLESSSQADNYLKRNQWQFYAATTNLIEEVSLKLGFRVWWRQPVPDFPFRILVLASPDKSNGQSHE